MNNRLFIGTIITILLLVAGYVIRNHQALKNKTVTTLPEQTQREVTATSSPSTSTSTIPLTECNGKAIPALTEGPYYKVNTPERTNLTEPGISGEKIVLSGYVFNTDCQPIANVWLDFWQADGSGVYDNSGYRLRGHQFTDASGKYMLETVVPGRYPGRTPHIHVKIRVTEKSPIITSQLFFPGESQNETDSIFDRSLVMQISNRGNGQEASFNFVVPQ